MVTSHRSKIATFLVFCALLLVTAAVPAFAADDGTGDPASPAAQTPAAPVTPTGDQSSGDQSSGDQTGADQGSGDQTQPDTGQPVDPPPATSPSSDGGHGSTGNTSPPSTGGATGATGSTDSTGTTGPIAGGGATGTTTPDATTAAPVPEPTPVGDSESAPQSTQHQAPKSSGTVTEPRRAGKPANKSANGAVAGAQSGQVMSMLRRTPASGSTFGRSLAGDTASRATSQIERNAEAGAVAALVVTRIINQIPTWIFWALAALAIIAAAGIALYVRERLRRRSAEQEAMVDQLTGISNRKAFDRRLDLEYRRAARYGRSLGLMVMDLDGFKQVNDSAGHAAGDRVLRQVGQALQKRMRDTDLVARIGGDEFAVICPETGINELMTIRRHLSQQAVDGVKEKVGLSIGVAEFIPSDGDPTSLLARADESMYRVKRGEATALPA